jgi:uncharacterized protein (AIM24 family)
MLQGGIANIMLTGPGLCAITSHGSAIVLPVGPNSSAFTDPDATVAWSSNLKPTIRLDLDVKTLIRGRSGETVQLSFSVNSGAGFVIIQPFEEISARKARRCHGGGGANALGSAFSV